jgi:DNA-directed RNA polymerase delta subunit
MTFDLYFKQFFLNKQIELHRKNVANNKLGFYTDELHTQTIFDNLENHRYNLTSLYKVESLSEDIDTTMNVLSKMIICIVVTFVVVIVLFFQV